MHSGFEFLIHYKSFTLPYIYRPLTSHAHTHAHTHTHGILVLSIESLQFALEAEFRGFVLVVG